MSKLGVLLEHPGGYSNTVTPIPGVLHINMPGVQACSTCAHLSTHKGVTANFDVYGTICNLYLCEHHAIITTQWSLKVMSHDYNNYNNNYYIHIMYIILWICLNL